MTTKRFQYRSTFRAFGKATLRFPLIGEMRLGEGGGGLVESAWQGKSCWSKGHWGLGKE
jgi:hypothetical protein